MGGEHEQPICFFFLLETKKTGNKAQGNRNKHTKLNKN